MAATREEITATYLGERVRFDQCVIGSAQLINGSATLFDTLEVTIKGDADEGELRPGVQYRFMGRWSNYTNKRTNKTEKQFQFDSYVIPVPHGKLAVVKYLQLAGLSSARATLLWDEFGEEAVAKLRDEPEEAAAVLDKRFTKAHALEVAAKLRTLKASEGVLIDVVGLLAGRHFRKKTPMLAVKKWGEKAAEIIKRNPYALMEFPGAGFKLCDKFYCDLKLPQHAIKRQALCAWHKLQTDSEGHTWHPIEAAVGAIKGSVSGTTTDPQKALRVAKRAGRIATIRTNVDGMIDANGQRLWVAEARRAENERYVAEKLARLYKHDPQWPDVGRIKHISDHQRGELAKALQRPVGCFTGGPGTGKSHTTAAFAELLFSEFGINEVAFAAPTNKAAVQLTTRLNGYGFSIQATSHHRLLGVETVEGGNWKFRHNETNPLPYKVICLDESPMKSTDILASILRACPPGTHILFIGDINQLPPIQHGAPFRDMIAAGFPVGELTEPQRNAGDIVFACDDIRQGKRFRESETIRLDVVPPQNFKIAYARTPQEQIDKLMMLIEQARSRGLDPIWDVQVMVAVNTASAVSRKVINDLLQRELNGGGRGAPGSPFKIGDKVVCEDNAKYKLVGDGETGEAFIAKGEFGQVVGSEAKLVTVKFTGPDRVVRFPRGDAKEATEERSDDPADGGDEDNASSKTGCSLELAYGATVHKMQGSECKFAIPILDEAHARRLCSREWFFTAISRGKTLTVPVGQRDTADAMCRRQLVGKRKTFLVELLRKELDA